MDVQSKAVDYSKIYNIRVDIESLYVISDVENAKTKR